jgi:hypothetical protein
MRRQRGVADEPSVETASVVPGAPSVAKAEGTSQFADFKSQMMDMIVKAGGLRMFCKSLKSDAHPLHTRVCTSMNKLLSHCFKLRDRVESGAMHLRLTQPCMFACLDGLRWVCAGFAGRQEENSKTKLCSQFITHQRRR